MSIAGVLRNARKNGVKATWDRLLQRRLDPVLPSKYLQAKYLKTVLPGVYEAESKKPIEPKIVIMERGARLSPNFQCLIPYLKQHTDYKIDIHVLKIRSVSDLDYYLNAVEYIRSAATAQAIFICTANELMSRIELRPETTYVQLWHGCGACKRFGLSTSASQFGKSDPLQAEYAAYKNYTYVTTSSPELSWIYEEAMGIDPDSGIISPIGVSRTDVFFDQAYIDDSRQRIEQAIPQTARKKIILYAPTFRGAVADATSPDQLDIPLLARTLGSEYVLIIKHHQTVKKTPMIPVEYEGSFAFDLTHNSHKLNINRLMCVADILITDYSSLAFEYSLFTRPMIFFAFDIDQYNDYRGMYYDYDEITPGPVVTTSQEIVDYIVNTDQWFDPQEVIDFKNRFMSACDGHSTERIVNLINRT